MRWLLTKASYGATLALVLFASLAVAWPASADPAPDTRLDFPFQPPTGAITLRGITLLASQFAIFLIIIAAAIFISIGAYFYFAAAGNASYAEMGKEYLRRSLFGLILGLIAYILLLTISPQFVELPSALF